MNNVTTVPSSMVISDTLIDEKNGRKKYDATLRKTNGLISVTRWSDKAEFTFITGEARIHVDYDDIKKAIKKAGIK